MRKLLVSSAALAALVFGILGEARAETPYEAMGIIRDIQKGADNGNQIDRLRVRTDAYLPSGSVESSEIEDGTIVAADLGLVSQVYTGAAAIAVTTYTPAFIGQLLIGRVSNTVHAAEDLTTNGWIQLN